MRLISLIIFIVLSLQVYADDISSNKIFDGGRFPSLIMTDKGTILSFWGEDELVVRRSLDKGKTFGPIIKISKGINSGGALFEKKSGTIIAFSQTSYPPSESFVHKSLDDGLTWQHSKIIYKNSQNERMTDLHFADNGISLESAKCSGRVIRPARHYGNSDGFNNAIYSDDLVKWRISGKFPINGTGEGAIVEMDDGNLLYSSRRHWFPNEKSLSPFRLFAKSYDCGETWQDPFETQSMFDGPRYRSLEEGKGPTHQSHFGLAGSMTNLIYGSSNILLHSNVYDEKYSWLRKGLVIYLSLDYGKNWKMSRSIHKGPAAYSSILVSENHEDINKSDIYILFEGGKDKEYEGGYFITKKLEDLFPSLN